MSDRQPNTETRHAETVAEAVALIAAGYPVVMDRALSDEERLELGARLEERFPGLRLTY